MDDKSFTIRVPKRWVRIALTVGVIALIVAPLTAVATHSFIDVPNSNTFHADIEWLKDANVTRGCNPPANTEFCPADNVTREQMAAFMRRLAANRVVDAGTLEGQTIQELLAAANSGLVGHEIVTDVENFSETTTFASIRTTASCPADTKVLGGGALVTNANGQVTSALDSTSVGSGPEEDGSGWFAFHRISNSTGDAFMVTTYAVCATSSD